MENRVPKKMKTHLTQELLDAVSILRRDVEQIASFPLGWQSISVQLNKILCERPLPLLTKVVRSPLLHPMYSPKFKSQLPADRLKWIVHYGWKIKSSENRTVIDCFDQTAVPLDLARWLDQVLLVANEEELSIEDVIRFPRNKEAAHSDPSLHRKVVALRSGLVLKTGNVEIEPVPLALAVVGAYVVDRIDEMLKG